MIICIEQFNYFWKIINNYSPYICFWTTACACGCWANDWNDWDPNDGPAENEAEGPAAGNDGPAENEAAEGPAAENDGPAENDAVEGAAAENDGPAENEAEGPVENDGALDPDENDELPENDEPLDPENDGAGAIFHD